MELKSLKNTWHKKLEVLMNQGNKRNRFEIISLAGEGCSTDTQLYELFKRGFKYKPDLIILGFCHNDIPDPKFFNCQGSDIRFFPHAKTIKWFRENLIIFQLVEFRLNRLLEKLKRKPRYTDCFNKRFESRGWDMELIYLDTILNSARIKNIHFMVSLIPIIYKLGEDYPLKTAHNKVNTYCKKRGIEFLDLYQKGFKGLNADKLIVSSKDNHLNEKGTDIVAKTLFSRLKPLKHYKYLSKFSGAFDLTELLNQKELVKKTDQNFNKLEKENGYLKFNSGNETLEVKNKQGKLHFLETVYENKKTTTYKIVLNEKGAFMKSEITFHKGNDSNIYFVNNKVKAGNYLISGGKLINGKRIKTTYKTFSLKYSTEGPFQKLELEQGKYFRDPKVFENIIFKNYKPKSFVEKVKTEKDLFDGLSYFFNYKSYFQSLQAEILNKKPSKVAISALGKLFLVKNDIPKFTEIKESNPNITFEEYKFEETPN